MNEDSQRTEEFVRLLSSNRGRLYAYIMSFVANHNDADDILQETTTTMWRKFEQFELGTDFLAWAATIAYYKILEHRKRAAKESRLQFCDELFEQINLSSLKSCRDADAYTAQLQESIQTLSEKDKELLRQRYWDQLSVNEISKRTGKTVRAIYYNLGRIHSLLAKRVKRGVNWQ
ncbi:sigma-70 family RNA polymerase sigma factor [Sedimentisphaera salicampi]|uniref:sigma-70 family RNA polymerase sigma factor n=1 Tax=Sedimentisphaera salicampi TaxID=1941349 RepID=UPI000B9ADE4C|nr:sigma-70 family RNA polymerase sigma factor [Sedimentisphaera salicampi]OXU14034.1 RNA polymerase sigma factor [Sedimentisphaera salicampi]